MASPARAERAALCDLFLDVGPDAPTLCGTWTTRDLAAHLVIRERRPDAAVGILSSVLAEYSERVRITETERPWTEIVERVRSGPPMWNPMHLEPVDTVANSVEFFVHHEDVRRSGTDWKVRQLPTELEEALATTLRHGGGFLTRKAKVGLVVEANGHPPMTLHEDPSTVTIRGPIGECVLYVYGRKDVARVDLDGPPDAVAAVAAAPFGI